MFRSKLIKRLNRNIRKSFLDFNFQHNALSGCCLKLIGAIDGIDPAGDVADSDSVLIALVPFKSNPVVGKNILRFIRVENHFDLYVLGFGIFLTVFYKLLNNTV